MNLEEKCEGTVALLEWCTLAHICKYGYVWDGDVLSKRGCVKLEIQGIIVRCNGYNWLTRKGVQMALQHDLLRCGGLTPKLWKDI